MRFKPDHKQATRERIIAAAGRLFRTHGYQGTGVDAIMAEAGLTPGGFYAHFASKEALFLETLSKCLCESAGRIFHAAAESDQPFATLVDRYLSTLHRDDPGTGCPLPNLASEVSRLTPAARRVFTDDLNNYLSNVEPFVPGATPGKRRQTVLATLSTLVGAMALARAVSDKALSDEIFASTRESLISRRAATSSKPKPVRKKPPRRQARKPRRVVD